ncbi:MAG TPA: ABC transporter substrate binding protein [bacterium]|nr:ABC transporter substrate binding protein [bacterium]
MRTLMMAAAVLLLAGLPALTGCNCGGQAAGPGAGAPKLVELIQFSDLPVTSEYRQSITGGLAEAGLAEGREYRLVTRSAQGEMPNVSALVDAAVADDADLLITFQPQALYAALQRAGTTPTVFAILDDPFVLGAGRTDTDHAANLTGQYFIPDFAKLTELILACRPATKKLGVMFQIGDDESAKRLAGLTAAAQARGVTVEALGYATAGDITATAAALGGKGVDGYVHLPEPYYMVTLTALAQQASANRLPVYSMAQGAEAAACLVSANDYNELARQFARLLARVIKGDDPATIPFQNSSAIPPQLIINRQACAAAGIVLPPEVLARATAVVD